LHLANRLLLALLCRVQLFDTLQIYSLFQNFQTRNRRPHFRVGATRNRDKLLTMVFFDSLHWDSSVIHHVGRAMRRGNLQIDRSIRPWIFTQQRQQRCNHPVSTDAPATVGSGLLFATIQRATCTGSRFRWTCAFRSTRFWICSCCLSFPSVHSTLCCYDSRLKFGLSTTVVPNSGSA
jgi:hypothetical protein